MRTPHLTFVKPATAETELHCSISTCKKIIPAGTNFHRVQYFKEGKKYGEPMNVCANCFPKYFQPVPTKTAN